MRTPLRKKVQVVKHFFDSRIGGILSRSVAAINFRGGWHLYLTWRFHTGEPRTPLTHVLVSQLDGSSACDQQFGTTHSERLPPYHSLDFRLTQWNPYSRWELTWYFQILNLYNRTNVDQYAFSERRDEETGILLGCEIEEEPMLPILPTLGVSVAF